MVLWGGRSGTDFDNSFLRRLDEGDSWMFCASHHHTHHIITHTSHTRLDVLCNIKTHMFCASLHTCFLHHHTHFLCITSSDTCHTITHTLGCSAHPAFQKKSGHAQRHGCNVDMRHTCNVDMIQRGQIERRHTCDTQAHTACLSQEHTAYTRQALHTRAHAACLAHTPYLCA